MRSDQLKSPESPTRYAHEIAVRVVHDPGYDVTVQHAFSVVSTKSRKSAIPTGRYSA